jgi:hypothetical protein
MSQDLRRLAERAAADPWFLGSVLATYQQRHGLDDAALAGELGANDTAVVVALRLCRRPGIVPERTAEDDIEEIARRFGVSAAALARVVEAAAGEAGPPRAAGPHPAG